MVPIMYMVIPCYCEEEVLPITALKFSSKLQQLCADGKVDSKSKILFVNDGSKDNTWEIIRDLCKSKFCFAGINLSRNVGHQGALMAGLMAAKEQADIVISMDADLQDDIEAVDEMIAAYGNGYDIVYGVRKERTTDSYLKKFTAESFYKLMKTLGTDIVYNHADYRLMSKRALESLSEFKEVNLFLRGIIPMIGYDSTIVYYNRQKREAGESKYPLYRMIFFAIEGITSCSIRLINYIACTGILISVLSFFLLIWMLVENIRGNTIQGWTSMTVSLWFLGGLQMFSLGVVGEYIGKIYLESKHRPRYIIKEFIN